MIDTLRISEAEKNVQQYLQDGLLFTKRKDIIQFIFSQKRRNIITHYKNII